jgi:CheY-like chemotaxis protein
MTALTRRWDEVSDGEMLVEALVLEDERDYASELQKALEGTGLFRCHIVTNVEDATDAACARDWDFLSVDLRIGGRIDGADNGWVVIRPARLRNPSIAVLVHTWHADRARQARIAGANEVLPKGTAPDPTRFAETAKRLVRRSLARALSRAALDPVVRPFVVSVAASLAAGALVPHILQDPARRCWMLAAKLQRLDSPCDQLNEIALDATARLVTDPAGMVAVAFLRDRGSVPLRRLLRVVGALREWEASELPPEQTVENLRLAGLVSIVSDLAELTDAGAGWAACFNVPSGLGDTTGETLP